MGKIRLTTSFVIFAAIVVGCESDKPSSRLTKLVNDARVQGPVYRSPLSVAVSPDGETLYVSDRTAGCVTVLDAIAGKKIRDVAIGGEPNALALSADGKTLYVARRKANSIALIDTAQTTVTGHISVGTWPVAVALAEKSNRLYSCNRGNHTVSVVDLTAGKEIKQIAVVRDPAFAVVTGDESRLVVANFMPAGAATAPDPASEISIIDTKAMRQTASVKLPRGSTMARGTWVSPDGKWAYVVHLLGLFDLPVTQLEQGWVHTTALSIIDLAKSERLATVLLDDLTQGAPDPWAVVGSRNGKKLWISHRGVHEVSTIDIGRIHELLEGKIPAALAGVKDAQRDNIWVRITKDKRQIAELARDLTALHISNTLARASSGGKGPTGMALGPDGKKLYVANYYGATVGVLDTAGGKLTAAISVGDQPIPDAARRGEIFFHDATRCYQRWHSCASCHLDGGRVDALTWDFMRDGIDNGKDVISLVYMHRTPPHNRRATRPNPWESIETGIVGSHQNEPAKPEVDDLLAYLKSLKPEPNPNLPSFAAAAKRGKVLFEGKANCTRCHPAPLFTDNKSYNVGTASAGDPDGRYDTPSLIEAYRTAPYYHDGRAPTMKEALTPRDPKGRHGRLKDLTPKEIEDLIAYVLSL
ncbi:MAG: beta-propeller fold lactonase family protein [Phycisphaerae bacterium]|jgi:YVTN family beta-propeller protein|nr:beta-propeller fold lactonase family protein [Phycisphaerae bacterium]